MGTAEIATCEVVTLTAQDAGYGFLVDACSDYHEYRDNPTGVLLCGLRPRDDYLKHTTMRIIDGKPGKCIGWRIVEVRKPSNPNMKVSTSLCTAESLNEIINSQFCDRVGTTRTIVIVLEPPPEKLRQKTLDKIRTAHGKPHARKLWKK